MSKLTYPQIMEQPNTESRRAKTFKKAKQGVANFLGVGGETEEEWQEKMGDWQRRSMVLHDQGHLMSKVDKRKSSVAGSAPQGRKSASETHPELAKNFQRPSIFKLAYNEVRDRMDKGRETRPVSRPSTVRASTPQIVPSKPSPELASEPLPAVQEAQTESERTSKKTRFAALPEPPEREIGKGLVGDLLNREYRKSRLISEVRYNMACLTVHRPFFTYWVMFVEIVLFTLIVVMHGIGPIGLGRRSISGNVRKTHVSVEPAYYLEAENMWIGPTTSALIHLGAKFSPCMRKDYNFERAIREDRAQEKETACCIYNDGSGCVQTNKLGCSTILSVWKKWPDSSMNRTSGTVCGQDPRLCLASEYSSAEDWPDDISEWPSCPRSSAAPDEKIFKHMNCELTGRPCCVGINGECIITSSQHCKFLKGYFHPNNTLCSQIYCLNAICGMIPFYEPNIPDQFARLISSQFIHAGVLQLLISLLFQATIMRDLEKLIGWLRLGMIYILSGMVGSLGSAMFLPYHVEAGPSGAMLGVSSCLFVEVIQSWYILYEPWTAFLKLCLILLALFIIGLLPMVDNYAHLFGFIYGFLLAFGLMPYITFNINDRRQKLISVVACLVLALVIFLLLIIFFYTLPIGSCRYCKYFNCVPFTKDICVGMEVNVSRDDPWFN